MQYLVWYLVYARCPLELMAHLEGVEIPPAELPDEELSPWSVAHDVLRDRLAAIEREDPYERYQLEAMQRTAGYLRRADRYGPALDAEGGRPALWAGAPVATQSASASSFERVVEAYSLVDACASSVRTALSDERAWATRHVRIPAAFDSFAEAVRRAFRTGFQCCCTTISHCSQSQWDVQFHGADRALRIEADVRLETTSGDPNVMRVTFLTRVPRHK